MLQRVGFVEIHQQFRSWERGEVQIDQLLLDRPAWQVRSPALAPVADGRDIHVIQIWMTVVAFAELDDQRAPQLGVQRIVGIRRPDRAVLARRRVGALRAGGLIPVRHRMLVVVRHDPDADPLTVTMRLGQRIVENLPAIGATLRLDLRPEPAQVGDARWWKVHRRASVSSGRFGTDLGPTNSVVERLAAESIECLDPHPRIHQQLVDLGWANDGCLRECDAGRGEPPDYRPHSHTHLRDSPIAYDAHRSSFTTTRTCCTK